MKVEFWGAAQTVTGSMHLVHWRGRRLLLDCGLFQGRRKLAFEINRKLPFAPSEVDAVVLSHAHIDHSGNLPSLVRNGFRGPIYATPPTRDLAEIMLLDSAKIQESDVEYVNRKRARAGKKPFEPLYVEDDALATIKQFRTAEFLTEFHPAPGIRCRFHVAGHMLGAASIEVLLENDGARPTRLVFSGDIGRPQAPILKDPTTVDGANYLIMEATYGDRVHPASQEVAAALLEVARETAEQKGKLLIPAFSLGRTQEIVYHLNRLFESGKLPRIPVIVDSPLAVDASEVFRKHQRSMDAEAREQALTEDDRDPLAFKLLRYVRKAEESKKLNAYDGPAIIISASGMCEAGRILHHLKNHAVKPNTTILFAGYQAPDTLGRRILEGEKRVRIFGDEFELKAKVLRLEATSGHADRNELLEWARTTSYHGQLKQIALVHGDLDASRPFAALLKENGLGPVIIPAKGDSMELK